MHASFDASKGRYGSPRIYRDLLEDQERVGPKRVVRLMQEEGLRRVCPNDSTAPRSAIPTSRSPPISSTGSLPPNRPTALGRRHDGVHDRRSGTLYLAAVLDLFSRFVVGWAVGASNDRHVTLRASHGAQRRCPAVGLLHHSDRGSTYASEDYHRCWRRVASRAV